MGSPRLKALELGEAERAALEALAVRRRTAQGLALRARIVLACAEMGSPRLVGAQLAVHPDTVRKWRHRFAEHRLEGLRDEPLGRATQDRRRADRGGDQPDSREPAGRRHALELARHGQGEWPVHRHGAADLAGVRPAATGSTPSSSRPTPTSSRRCATWSGCT